MVGRRNITFVSLLAVVALIAIAYLQHRRTEAENQTGILSSRVLSAVFVAKSELKVATLSGEVFAVAKGCSLNCWFPNGQETRAPYSVDYFVDLKKLSASSFKWNDENRIMSVDLPEIIVARPNIDMSRAKTKQHGVWISRESGIDMQLKAAAYLIDGANAKAKAPENLAKARNGMRKAVSRFVEAPLAAAGLSGVKVVVRLPGDEKPNGLSEEQWDVSRSIGDVIGKLGDRGN